MARYLGTEAGRERLLAVTCERQLLKISVSMVKQRRVRRDAIVKMSDTAPLDTPTPPGTTEYLYRYHMHTMILQHPPSSGPLRQYQKYLIELAMEVLGSRRAPSISPANAVKLKCIALSNMLARQSYQAPFFAACLYRRVRRGLARLPVPDFANSTDNESDQLRKLANARSGNECLWSVQRQFA